MDKRKGVTLFAFLIAVMLALVSPAHAYTTKVCSAKATTGTCSYNATRGRGRLAGHKTLAVRITGTANVTGACIIGNDEGQMSTAIGSAFTSSGVAEFDTHCSDVVVTINSCTTCVVDAWVGTDD